MNEEKELLKINVAKYTPHHYAGASGDFNPIHLDTDYAKSVGLDSLILHGLCTMAYTYKSVMGDNDPAKIKKLKVRFKLPVKPGDTLSFKGKTSKDENNTFRTELSVLNQNNEQVIVNGEAIIEK